MDISVPVPWRRADKSMNRRNELSLSADFLSPPRLRRDLEELLSFGPRSCKDVEATDRTIAYLTDSLAALGYMAYIEQFGIAAGECNIIAERPGQSRDDAVM